MSEFCSFTACGGAQHDPISALYEKIFAAAEEAQKKGERASLALTVPTGWHKISKPLVLSAAEHPALGLLDITISAQEPLKTTLHSLAKIPADALRPVAGKPYFTYQFPQNEDGGYPLFHDLFLNGHRIEMAKSPFFRNPIALTPEQRRGEEEPAGLYVPLDMAKTLAAGEMGTTEYMIYIEWQFCVVHPLGVDLSDTYEKDGVTYALLKIREEELATLVKNCHPELNIAGREVHLRNAPAFLTRPDTYAYDSERGVLYFLPSDKEAISSAVLEYPTLENLFFFDGLENLTIEGIDFTGTTSKYICNHVYYSGQANNECRVHRLRHAAIVTAGMRNLTVKGCAFRDLGGNGLLLTDDTYRATICDCRFENISMSALSVGNPTTEWENPKNRNYTVIIQNNLFRHIAYDYPSALCMYVGMVDGLKILNNTVDGCGYSGISVGWGWSRVYYELGERFNVRNAEIAYNRFRNFMDVLRDGAAIYVVGGNCDISNDTRFNCMHDNYATLDERRDGSKRGYYCDGSSTNWEVRHSVIVNCAIPIFSQYTVSSAFTYHNHLFDIYSTTPYQPVNHAPYRDTLIYDFHLVEGDEEALFRAHPIAREIRDAAGCNLPL